MARFVPETRQKSTRRRASWTRTEREFFIDNLLVQIHFIIVMIRWTGLAPWEFEFTFPGSLTSTFLTGAARQGGPDGGVGVAAPGSPGV